eukprot:gnl/Hemi2/16938_TR5629_c0_g1_i1.p1 gnl/Hemi2/16938_TR5629_c0_g1~~gnl/Hemi2/16938_TR5629_c0_g1_i1.p1  ORF type:complete len:234 (-),score=66.45 gnl/Hemi2/16938_TR5629_c0_g1_i1:63-722(-)
MALFRQAGRKIVAVGRNYAEHAKELGNALPSQPLFFLKPTSSYLSMPQPIALPRGIGEIHHEIELGIVIGSAATNVSETDAMSHVAGYALCLDMTARDLQDTAKANRAPWSAAKGYDGFCPVGEFIPKERVTDPHALDIWLKVNGAMRQNGNTSDMIFRLPFLISYISKIMTLEPNDLVLTGTPSGVGRVQAGDVLTAGLGASGTVLSEISFNVVDRDY